MTYLGFSGLINFITCIFLGIFVLLRNPRGVKNRTYFFLNSSVALYSIGYYIWQLCSDENYALLWFKVLVIGIILINVTYLHFVFAFIGILKKKRIELGVYYFINFIFILLNIRSLLYSSIEPRYSLGFWPNPTLFFNIYLIFWFWQCLYGFMWLIKGLKLFSGIKREQIKYFTFAAIIGFVGGATNWPMWYRIYFPPYLNILISVYIGLVAYAIVKYRLMDITVAVTRAGIFIVVYTVVLGLPFLFGFKTGLWILAMVFMAVLATMAPFMYNHFRHRAENILLEKQKKYQKALRELANEMSQIKVLDELLKSVVEKVEEIVNPQYIGIYIYSKGENAYNLKNIKVNEKYPFGIQILKDSSMVSTLYHIKKPIFIDIIKDLNMPNIQRDVLLVPQFVEGSLFSFMILGPKVNGMLYSEEDIAVFDILTNQVALAIEHCLYWEEEKVRLARDEQIRRQRSMDHFSASMAHEIDNPIFAVQCTVRSLKKTLFEEFQSIIPEDKVGYLENKVNSISKNLMRISKMIKAVREFSKQTTGEFEVILMDQIVETYLSIIEPQIKFDSIIFNKDIEPNILIRGNKIHLEEALINLTTNAIHAVKYNNKANKKIDLKIFRNGSDKFLIKIIDNGYGIKKDLLNDIFLDFVTTKASTEVTGMGLARVRKIVENHGGRIWVESEGENKGATFILEMPIMKKDNKK